MAGGNDSHSGATAGDTRFVQISAALLLVLTIVAFAPRYILPLLGGEFEAANPWMHPHAFAGFVFAALFLAQPTLIARRKIALHRTLGRIAGVLVVLAVISGVGVQLGMFPAGENDLSNRFAAAFRLFQTLPAMVIFFGGALLLKRKTQWHWRWMYLAAFSAFNTVSHRLLKYYTDMPEVSIMPLVGLITLAPVVALIIYDKLAHEKVHRASWAGALIMIALQALAFMILSTSFWAGLIGA